MDLLRRIALLLSSAGFVAIAVVIAIVDPAEGPMALATGSFFGLCLAVFVYQEWERYTMRKAERTPGVLTVLGGAPIRQSRRRLGLIAGALAVVGTAMAWGGQDISPLFVGLSVFVAAVGVVLGIGLATGLAGSPFLQFDPEGLTLGSRRQRYQVPWDQIAAVGQADLSGNPMILLDLYDREVVLGTVDPAHRAAKVRKAMASATTWQGAPIAIVPGQFGLNAVRLRQAITRYATEPGSRAELVGRFASPTP